MKFRFNILITLLSIVVSASALSINQSSATVSQDDIYVLEDASKNVKDLKDFESSCYLKSNTDPAAISDCTAVMKSFNLKMAELNKEYGTLINKIINE